jgi:hypothetical protein
MSSSPEVAAAESAPHVRYANAGQDVSRRAGSCACRCGGHYDTSDGQPRAAAVCRSTDFARIRSSRAAFIRASSAVVAVTYPRSMSERRLRAMASFLHKTWPAMPAAILFALSEVAVTMLEISSSCLYRPDKYRRQCRILWRAMSGMSEYLKTLGLNFRCEFVGSVVQACLLGLAAMLPVLLSPRAEILIVEV